MFLGTICLLFPTLLYSIVVGILHFVNQQSTIVQCTHIITDQFCGEEKHQFSLKGSTEITTKKGNFVEVIICAQQFYEDE